MNDFSNHNASLTIQWKTIPIFAQILLLMDNTYPALELKTSEDGSSTIYRADIDEHYHSIHGAIQESMHVFIKAGLEEHPGKELNILEIGLGTGLNALLTMIHHAGRIINYHSIERWPLQPDIISKINYSQCLDHIEACTYFNQIHSAEWNKEENLTSWFNLYKEETDLRQFISGKKYDVVYFDAFGPEKQPELWTPEIFERLANSMSNGAILTTYSCKGTVKRAIQQAGLKIEKIPGPPGKREILRARKE